MSDTAIDVSWGAATDNVGVTAYRVERCQGAGCASFAQVATTSSPAYSDSGLTGDTTYRYRVRAEDAAGNLGPYAAVGEATTPAPPDTEPPTAPGPVTATAVNQAAIDVNWTAATDNVGVTGYRVERCQGAGCADFLQVAAPAGTSYQDTGLTAGTTYRYRVRAEDAAGNPGAYSTVGGADTPGVSGLVAAYSFDAGSGTTLADDSGNGNVGQILGATWTAAGKYGQALSFNGNGNYVDLGDPAGLRLTGSMTWSAWVYATGTPADDGQIIAKSGSGGGNLGWQFKTSPDTGPHTFGVAVSSNGATNTQRYSTTVRALNTWYYVAGVYDAAARTLHIYVNGVLDDGTLSGSVPAAQYDPAENVAIGRRNGGFYFQGTIDEVRLYDRALTAAEVQADMNTPLGTAVPDTQPPTAPGGLTATAASGTQVDLSWGAAADTVGVTGYRVERCAGAGCTTFVEVAAPSGTSYSDTGVLPATTYRYRVRAADGAGNLGPYSSIAAASTPSGADTQAPSAPGAVAAAAVSSSAIEVSWGPATDNVGVTGYRIERCAGAGCTTFVEVAAPSGTSYGDTGLAGATPYRYRVRAADAAGNLGPYASVATAATLDGEAPSAPGTLVATAANGSQVELIWGAATDDAGVTAYRVERCEGAGCAAFVQVATPSAPGYTDTELASGTPYRYRVRAADAAGNLGPYSNVADVTTPATPPGLVAAYAFDAGSGTTAEDVSGHGNTGTIVGATWTSAGRYGDALSFNGRTSYVNLGNPAGLRLTGSMTWSAWVYATGTPADDGQIVTKSGEGSGAAGWQFKTSPDTGPHTFGVAVSSNGATHTQRYSATIRALRTWYYVAGVYDAAARTLHIYVNGALDDGVLNGTVPASQYDPAQNVTIGRRSGGFYFQGVIDEVRVYDRALTAAEIQLDMNTPLAALAAGAPAGSTSLPPSADSASTPAAATRPTAEAMPALPPALPPRARHPSR